MAKKRGVGIGAVHYSTGQSGGGDPSQVMLKMRSDGCVDIIMGSIDIGQGVRTIMRQIAAQELGVSLEKVNVSLIDTDIVPLDTGTFASRVTHQTGNAVKIAAAELRKGLLETAAKMMHVHPGELELRDDKVYSLDSPREAISIAEVANQATWVEEKLLAGRGAFGWPIADVDPETGKGDPVHTLAYGATLAEVEVDTETGQVEVKRMFSAYDCGKAINPMLVEGQIDGGNAMGLGSALMEELHPYYPTLDEYPTGLFEYLIPTAADVPDMKSLIVETISDTGPYGAKGIGEMTANTEAPAIINAIHDAVGVWITDLPATPEKVLRALEEKEKGKAE